MVEWIITIAVFFVVVIAAWILDGRNGVGI
jgi:hypothetical protein